MYVKSVQKWFKTFISNKLVFSFMSKIDSLKFAKLFVINIKIILVAQIHIIFLN